MSDPVDRSLDDIMSSLNEIREILGESLQASNHDELNDEKDSGKPDEEINSFALEEYLAGRLQQIGEVIPEQKEVGGLRTGNGWDAGNVVEQVYKIEPISTKHAIEVAISSKRKIKERISSALKGLKEEFRLVGTPIVEFVPIWKIRGFHECYYLRANTYRVNVKSDVVALEVEGKSRDLILERKHRRFIPAAIIERFQKLGSLLSSESKYFVMSEVVELATKRSDSELVLAGNGRALDPEEEAALTSWRSKRIFDVSDLKVRGARVKVHEPTIPKERVLNQFREQVVRMPERFRQILSNRLQISELKRIYVPFIRVPMQKGLVPSEVVVNGASGDVADDKLLELLD